MKSRDEFNEKFRYIIDNHSRKIKRVEGDTLHATQRDRDVEAEIAKLCEDKPIRRINSKWIKNE